MWKYVKLVPDETRSDWIIISEFDWDGAFINSEKTQYHL